MAKQTVFHLPADRATWTFDQLLSWHLARGTRATGHPGHPGRRWTYREFADALHITPLTLWHWRKGRRRPAQLLSMELVLFGENEAYSEWREELRNAYSAAGPGHPAGSRHLDLSQEPQPNIDEHPNGIEPEPWELYLSDDHQSRIGGQWVDREDHFVLDLSGEEDDDSAARAPLVKQLHEAVLRKAGIFSGYAVRPDNAYGWLGIREAAQRFFDTVNRDTSAIPDVLGYLYDATIELGSYLEQDKAVRLGTRSGIDPLDEEVRRSLADLIQTAAPWVRRFPSARALDDECGAFLSKAELLDLAHLIITSASRCNLVTNSDAAHVEASLRTAQREGLQGSKAGARGISTTRNLTLRAATVLCTFYVGAVSSAYSTQSIFVRRVASFIVTTQKEVATIVGDLPDDIRNAVNHLIARVINPSNLTGPNQEPLLQPTESLSVGDGDGTGDLRRITELLKRAEALIRQNEHDSARSCLEEAIAISSRSKYALGRARALHRLGDIARWHSEMDAARAAYDSALALYQNLGDSLSAANCRWGLGDVALWRQEKPAAEQEYAAALSAFRQIGNVRGEAGCVVGLGHIARYNFDYDRALTMYDLAAGLFHKLGDVRGEADCAYYRGDLARGRQQSEEARSHYMWALDRYKSIKDPLAVGWAHYQLAKLPNDGDRTMHIAEARAAWLSIGRTDLVERIDHDRR